MNLGTYRMIDLWREMAFSNDEITDITRKHEISNRQIGVLKEELNELETALAGTIRGKQYKDDIVEAIDGYCDVLWVACMLSSIHHFNPVKGVAIRMRRSKIYSMNKNNFKYRHQRLQRSIRKLEELSTKVFEEDRVALANFKDHLISVIYRAYQGLIYVIGRYQDDPTLYADHCIASVIYSNFSKCVDGRLLKDATGKITKQPAKDQGTYLEPDFSFVFKSR